MSNVFTIIGQYDAIMAELEENGGELTPELAAKLSITEQELATKIRAYYYVIKTKEAEIQLAKDEQARLMDVRKSKEGVITRLKKTVDLAVETFGSPKPSGVKGLDLGDLKVWQKKTVALELNENYPVDDDRFCTKQVTFNLNYEDAEVLLKAIEELGNPRFHPTVTTVLEKDKLKEWLIQYEEYFKEQRDTFEEELKRAVDAEQVELLPDVKIALATNLKHNSTVIFK